MNKTISSKGCLFSAPLHARKFLKVVKLADENFDKIRVYYLFIQVYLRTSKKRLKSFILILITARSARL